MTDNPRIRQLLDALLESQSTPEEACASCPELLPKVRRRWKQLRHLQEDLDALFPASSGQGTSRRARQVPNDSLPEIPGYRVEGVLGNGGMGVVYRAWHERLHRSVALKMLLTGSHSLSTERDRFEREAEAVAALHHPNIVQIYDLGDVNGQPFFTMEYVDGGSLANAIQGIPQPAQSAAKLVATLADAIHAAHQRGIVHRDLKPGNVLLTSDGTPKVTDFGLAWRLEGDADLSLSGVPMGTPSYMSPCQARGDKSAMGPATDIWALGAILYELLTGRPPFRSDSAGATLHQVAYEDPVPPRRLNPQVPRDLQTIALKCLRKEPQNRYASAQALADDLRRFERGEPIKARPVGPVERAVRWVRRQPTLAGAIIVGAMLAAAFGATVVSWYVQRTATVAAAMAYAQADLNESQRLLDQGELQAASAVLGRAQERLAGYVSPGLLDRLTAAVNNVALVTRMDFIRMRRAILTNEDDELDTRQSNQDYEEAFRLAGWGADEVPAKIVAQRVNDSPARKFVIAALDDWAVCTPDQNRRARLLEIARLVDPDPWRDRARDPDPEAWVNLSRLAELTRAAPVTQESVQLLCALGSRLLAAGGTQDAVAYLRRVQQAHPADFYANNLLGTALIKANQYDEAVGYFRAALAVRPGSAVAWDNLGYAMLRLNRWNEARAAYEVSLQIEPDNGWSHLGLGEALRHQQLSNSAIEHLQLALRLIGPVSRIYSELAFALQQQERWDEAISHFRQAAALSPDMPWYQYDLGMALNRPSSQDEAIEYLRRTLALNPNYPEARRNLIRILLERGRVPELVAELQRATSDTALRAELRKVLARLGRYRELCAAWKEDLEAGPPNHDDWFGYAELCLFLDLKDEYLSHRDALLSQFGATTDPTVAERVGRACLLLTIPEVELKPAVALTDRAVAAGRAGYEYHYPFRLFAQGLARYRQGRFDDAVNLMTGEAAAVMGPCPRLVLAMAQFQKGRHEEARVNLAEAISSYDWSESKALDRDAWISHILRREAEALIGLNQPPVEIEKDQ